MRSAILCAASIFALSPAAGRTYEVLLDYNLDDDPETFRNVVEGHTVPVDVIFRVEEHEDGMTFPRGHPISVSWLLQKYDLYCWDSVGWGHFSPSLPDVPPFTNIEAGPCLCRDCPCGAQYWIHADSGPLRPGYYKLLTFRFSREGTACQGPSTYAEASVQVNCPTCSTDPSDPRLRVLVAEDVTAVDAASWGTVKARYR